MEFEQGLSMDALFHQIAEVRNYGIRCNISAAQERACWHMHTHIGGGTPVSCHERGIGKLQEGAGSLPARYRGCQEVWCACGFSESRQEGDSTKKWRKWRRKYCSNKSRLSTRVFVHCIRTSHSSWKKPKRNRGSKWWAFLKVTYLKVFPTNGTELSRLQQLHRNKYHFREKYLAFKQAKLAAQHTRAQKMEAEVADIMQQIETKQAELDGTVPGLKS